MSAQRGNAEAIARAQLGELLEVHPVAAPLLYGFGESASDCNWFGVSFPNDRKMGAGHVIGIRKSDGSVAYFGSDGGE